MTDCWCPELSTREHKSSSPTRTPRRSTYEPRPSFSPCSTFRRRLRPKPVPIFDESPRRIPCRGNELAAVVKPRPRAVNTRAREFAFTNVEGSHKYPREPPGAQPCGLLYFRESLDLATWGTVVTECEPMNQTVNRAGWRGPGRTGAETGRECSRTLGERGGVGGATERRFSPAIRPHLEGRTVAARLRW